MGLVIIQPHDDAAHRPAGGVAQRQRENGVADEVGHDEEIELAEADKAGQHDVHGRSAVARPPQGGGIDLVGAADDEEGDHVAQEEGAVFHHRGLVVEEDHQPGGGGDDGGGDDHSDACRHPQGGADTTVGPLGQAAAQILAHKGGAGQRQGLDGQDEDLIDLGIGRPAAHGVGTELVDVGLDEDVGEGRAAGMPT